MTNASSRRPHRRSAAAWSDIKPTASGSLARSRSRTRTASGARPIRMQMIANEVPTRLESSCSSQAVRYRA